MDVVCTIVIKSTLFQTRPRIRAEKTKEEFVKQVLFFSSVITSKFPKSFIGFGFGILVFKITDSPKLVYLSSKSDLNDKR